jgi:hypothetical protein
MQPGRCPAPLPARAGPLLGWRCSGAPPRCVAVPAISGPAGRWMPAPAPGPGHLSQAEPDPVRSDRADRAKYPHQACPHGSALGRRALPVDRSANLVERALGDHLAHMAAPLARDDPSSSHDRRSDRAGKKHFRVDAAEPRNRIAMDVSGYGTAPGTTRFPGYSSQGRQDFPWSMEYEQGVLPASPVTIALATTDREEITRPASMSPSYRSWRKPTERRLRATSAGPGQPAGRPP